MEKRIIKLLIIVSTSILILFNGNCQNPVEPDKNQGKEFEGELFITNVKGIKIPDIILDAEPLEITFSAHIGDSSCYALSNIETIKTENQVDIWVWSIHDTTGDCIPANIYLEQEVYKVEPPFHDPTKIIIHQPGDSLFEKSVEVRYISQDPQWVNYTRLLSGLPSNDIYALIANFHDYVWAATDRDAGIFVLRDDIVIPFESRMDELHHRSVESMDIDNQGNIWVGSFNSSYISTYSGKDWELLRLPNSDDSYDDVHAITIDQQNNIWIGTHYSRLYMYDRNTWTEMDTIWSLRRRYTEALAVDSQNNIWVGLNHGMIGKFDGQSWIFFNVNNASFGNYRPIVSDLKIDHNDHIWITTYGEGLFEFDGVNWVQYSTSNSNIPSDDLLGLSIDSQGNLWLSSLYGLISYNHNSWTIYNYQNSGLLDDRVWTVGIDSKDQIWIGSDFGLTVFRNGN